MKNVIIKSDTWFFNLTNVIGVNVTKSKGSWYEFKKGIYRIHLSITYDEHDFNKDKTYEYRYKTKKDRDLVMKRLLDMDFDDFNKTEIDSIVFDFKV